MPVSKGLAGIQVDNTSISEVDGIAGQLRYRGYPVEALIDLPFTDVAYLILHGELPTPAQANAFAERLQRQSAIDPELGQTLLALGARARHPMLALQSAIPLLSPTSASVSTSMSAALYQAAS